MERLTSVGIEASEARRELDLIVEHVTGLTLAQQIACDDIPILGAPVKEIESIIGKRVKRQPLQYCLGFTEFMGLRFNVGPGVLIPRPDTETLVEKTLTVLDGVTLKKNMQRVRLIEIGSGSGCICVSLLKIRPDLEICAVDISDLALKYSKENAELHGVQARLQLVQGDWFAGSDQHPATAKKVASESLGRFDGLVANPPYVPLSEAGKLAPEVAQFEPKEALFGLDQDGLGCYRVLSRQGQDYLKSGGFIAVELGFGQSEQVADIFRADGWTGVELTNDLNKIPRVLSAFRPD
jgi:release factor glutamine methyltransferase